MIRIAGVSKTFSVKDNKVEALKNVSLDIAKGDIYGIIGMSGAGKSTLVRCLNFLERPTEGTVYVEGQDLSTLDAKQLRQLRKHVAMIFQNFNLLMQRTVLDLSLIHISEPTRQEAIAYAVFCLKKFFFNDTATTEIYTLHIVGSVRCV